MTRGSSVTSLGEDRATDEQTGWDEMRVTRSSTRCLGYRLCRCHQRCSGCLSFRKRSANWCPGQRASRRKDSRPPSPQFATAASDPGLTTERVVSVAQDHVGAAPQVARNCQDRLAVSLVRRRDLRAQTTTPTRPARPHLAGRGQGRGPGVRYQ